MFLRVVLLLIVNGLMFAQADKPKLPGEDWVPLFNGKDLSGWTSIGKEEWSVEDGVIHGKAISKAYGYLQTEKAYKDFHLSIKFKCVGDGNSGVFYHVAFKPGTADVSSGMQFEIDCAINRHTGGVYDNKRAWIVWPSPENETVVRQGDWNEYLLKVEGNRYMARLNGVQVLDYTDPKPNALDGPIALQLHSGGRGDMMFKDVLIRDLSKR